MVELRSVASSLRHLLATLVLVVLCSLIASAQFDTGTIAGTVTDPSGAMVAGATITITNVGTSIARTLQTDSSGNFVASAVPFGNYIVSAQASGFAEAKTQTIVLNVGATVRVNLALTMAAAEQSIEVTGTTTTVATESTTVGTTLTANQIANLPVNGRDVSNFLTIAPGSVGSAGFFQGSVNGLENIFSGLNITVDGQNASRGDINGFLDTEGGEAARITRASLDSIQEINFANNGFNAENGRSLGPQMNIITKPGTNQFHGTLFEFFRNDALDANAYFENNPNTPKQPLRMNQFGANLSGPIVRGKVFFFMNYEGVRQRLSSINALSHTLSAHARSLFVESMQPVLAQMAPLPAGCIGDPAPDSCIYNNNPDFVVNPSALPTTLREDTGSIRLDYNMSDKDRIFFRYNINDSITHQTYGQNQGQVAPQALRTQLAKLDETHTFTPTLLNEFSVSVNRFHSDTNSNTPTPLAGFSGFFTDLGSLPGPNTFNQVNPFTVFEVFDSVTKTVSRHTLKAGTQIRINRLNQWLRPQQTYSYASVSDLVTNNPFALSKIGFPNFVGIRNSNWDFYVQDDWRITPRLTVNLGLRYDYNTVWREGHNRQQNFDFATQSFLPSTDAPYHAPTKDFAPRVGFSYDPFGRGKTVVHGYGGLFYMPMQSGFGLVTNVGELSSYTVTIFDAIFHDPPYSIAYPADTPPLPLQNVNIFPQHPKDPYSTNWLFGVQQELFPSTILTANYTGNRVRHLQAGVNFAAINLNPGNVTDGARPLPNFASENYNSDGLSSSYDALQVQLRRNLGRLTLEANYTWSHEIDNLVNVFGGWSDPYNPNIDRGSGDWDVRHNFTASVLYALPELKSSSALARGVLGGWQTSSIIQTRTGLPTNVQLISGFFGVPMRPDSVSGQSPYLQNVSWPTQSFNPAAFEIEPDYNGVWGDVIGTVGRNPVRGPGFFQWDFSLMKNFPITETVRLQFRTDLFNIFNHPNFANPDGGICTALTPATPTTPASCTPNTNFGRVSQTVADVSGGAIGNGTSRQAQFSLKLIF
jgi:carboxypeptidase family protein